jgi:CubicO group peptidase (beta-lactamase class C family)
MSMSHSAGDPAFPTTASGGKYGMSMRDYFAAAALSGLMSRPPGNMTEENAAKEAYRYADAMIQVR